LNTASEQAASSPNLTVTSTWQQISVRLDVTSPDGGSTLGFTVVGVGGAGTCFLIDDAELYRVQ
jgi:hypothetical protein